MSGGGTEAIFSDEVARGNVPLAHAVRANGFVFVSGIPPFRRDGSLADDFPSQMRQCLENVGRVLASAGTSIERVAKVNVYLASRADVGQMNELYREAFGSDPSRWPARTTIVALLPREEFLVEIECIAALPEERR